MRANAAAKPEAGTGAGDRFRCSVVGLMSGYCPGVLGWERQKHGPAASDGDGVGCRARARLLVKWFRCSVLGLLSWCFGRWRGWRGMACRGPVISDALSHLKGDHGDTVIDERLALHHGDHLDRGVVRPHQPGEGGHSVWHSVWHSV